MTRRVAMSPERQAVARRRRGVCFVDHDGAGLGVEPLP